MKWKFRVYGWTTFHRMGWGLNILPSIDLDFWREDKGEPIHWAVLMFSWLIFGITFDWRKEQK